MTTRAKRTAKPPKIEALISQDRELLKTLVKESLQEVLEAEMTEALGARAGERTAEPARLSGRLLQSRPGDADRQARAAGAAGPGRPVLDRPV